MRLQLYRYLGEKNKIDKSGDLIQVGTCYGSFKGETSVLNPSLLLSLPLEGTSFVTDEDGNLIDDIIVYDGNKDEILNFNYFYIKEFRRFYFVSSIVVSSNNLLIVSGEVDPLYSFKDQILANDAFIERNEFDFDALLPDSLLPTESLLNDEEIPLSHGGNRNISFSAYLDEYSDYNIALTFSNQATNGNPPTITEPLGSSLPPINREAFAYSDLNVFALRGVDLGGLALDMLLHSSVADFVLSAVAFPFDIELYNDSWPAINIPVVVPDTEGITKIVTFANTKGKHALNVSEYLVLGDFTFPAPTDFFECDPEAAYSLWVPFVGWVNLSARELGGHAILVYYSVDYTDGSATAYVYDDSKGNMIYNGPCQIGVQVPITKTNAEQNRIAYTSLVVNALMGAVSGSLSALASYYGGDSGKAASKATGAIAGAVGDYLKSLSLFPSAQTSPAGSMSGLYAPLDLHLRRVSKKVIPDLSKFAHQYGRPLRDVRKLSTLSGFTQVSKVHLEGCDATEGEKTQIESSLLAGVIL
ncbi:MAG: hypothetical protein IIY58_05870 [Aeriscardovia sp.]|nr:hypothetical protein [Aeriscardovia sp.]